jgi:hypothetical protein
MKNSLLIALFMVSVISVHANEKKTARKEKKAEKEALLVEQTKNMVEEQAWHFDATQMMPSGGQSRTLMDYSVVLKDGILYSYLPYMGRAYSGGYGGTDSPLIFEAPIEEYSVSEGKKGSYIIKIKTKNESETIDYTFNVSSKGSVSLSAQGTNRTHISFHGNLMPIPSA